MRALQKLGYANVKDYKGGKAEWLEKGLPIETSPPATLWERMREWFG